MFSNCLKKDAPIASASVPAVVEGNVLVRSFDVGDDVAEQLSLVRQLLAEIVVPSNVQQI